MSKTCIVIPCYNEERRLDGDAWVAFARETGARLLFVDDGSTDGTAARLHKLATQLPAPQVRVLCLRQNQGKGEAVRQGLRMAMISKLDWVGYADADGATPTSELQRMMVHVLPHAPAVVLGSRVRLLGNHVTRRPTRHMLGRVFATAASIVLRVPVYDTQCGAKFFRATPLLAAALEAPFVARWIFDVELLGRLLVPSPGQPALRTRDFLETPLRKWRDVGGSQVKYLDVVRAAGDLARIAFDVETRRRAMSHRRHDRPVVAASEAQGASRHDAAI